MYRNVSLRILSTFTSGVGVLSFPRVAMCMLALWTHDLYYSFPCLFSFPSLPLCPTACLCLWRVFTSIRAEIYVTHLCSHLPTRLPISVSGHEKPPAQVCISVCKLSNSPSNLFSPSVFVCTL